MKEHKRSRYLGLYERLRLALKGAVSLNIQRSPASFYSESYSDVGLRSKESLI